MTADIVNLRTARKQKRRLLREAEAAENRARSGQSKSAKTLVQAHKALAEHRLDQAKRIKDDDPTG